MSLTKGLIMSILVFSIVSTILFGIANQLNTNYGVTVNSSYNKTFSQYYSVKENVNAIGNNSPGSPDSKIGTQTSMFLFSGSFAVASSVYNTLASFKDILIGTSNSNGTLTSQGQYIDPIWGDLAFTYISLILFVTLIGAFIFNRI